MSEQATHTCRICWDSDEADFFQPCLCNGTQQWVHKSCFLRWTDVAPSMSCPTCGYRYRRGISSLGKLARVAGQECARWLGLLAYLTITKTSARLIYKRLLPAACDGRPFSFNLYWPAGYLMDALDPQPARVLLADSVVGGLCVMLKRLARIWRVRLPLLWPPPVFFPSVYQELAMRILCASTLRLFEVLLLLKGKRYWAWRMRDVFDGVVNAHAVVYLTQEMLRSYQLCIKDSTQVLPYKSV